LSFSGIPSTRPSKQFAYEDEPPVKTDNTELILFEVTITK